MRTRVHEYGGGAWCLVEPDLVVFVDFADQRLYRQRLGEEPVAISPEPPAPAALRYADMRLDAGRQRRRLRARTRRRGRTRERDRLAAARRLRRAAGAGGRPRLLLVPADQPRRRLARLDLLGPPEHALGRDRAVGRAAGRPRRGAARRRRSRGVGLPARVGARRAPPLRLRPRRLVEPLPRPRARRRAQRRGRPAGPADRPSTPTSPIRSGSSAAPPTPSSRAARSSASAARAPKNGSSCCEPEGWEAADLGLPFTSFGYPVALGAAASGSPSPPPARRARPRSSSTTSSERRDRGGTDLQRGAVDPAYVSRPRAIEFPTGEGEVAHGFYYPPANPEFEAPEGELPPLIVESHGGPTSHATPALDREFLYWTSRGIGVVDVNYRG